MWFFKLYVRMLFKYFFLILLSHVWSSVSRNRQSNLIMSSLNMQLSCYRKLSQLIVFYYIVRFWKILWSCLKKLSRMKLIMFLKIIIQKWICMTTFSFNLLNSYHICLLSFSIAVLLILSFVINWLSNCEYRNRLLLLNFLKFDNLD